MIVKKTKIKDLLVFESKNFYDKRGLFRELALEKLIKKRFIFSVVSKSKRNVLRGLHMQKKFKQGKYVSVLKGKVLDVVVDCRKKSKTFGKHYKIILSEKNCKSIFIPQGFIHGFLGLEKENIINYMCTNYRNKNSEIGVKWDDVSLKINWNIKKPILSQKDKNNLNFKDIKF
jgi:dTDP-4-dehydrorhamnose 3,5-epimerase